VKDEVYTHKAIKKKQTSNARKVKHLD